MQGGEVVAFLGLAAGMTIVLVNLTRAYMRRLEFRERQRHALSTDERMDRLVEAVDAIAVEVERISEGQRFVTKLLTERGEAGQPALRAGDGERD